MRTANAMSPPCMQQVVLSNHKHVIMGYFNIAAARSLQNHPKRMIDIVQHTHNNTTTHEACNGHCNWATHKQRHFDHAHIVPAQVGFGWDFHAQDGFTRHVFFPCMYDRRNILSTATQGMSDYRQTIANAALVWALTTQCGDEGNAACASLFQRLRVLFAQCVPQAFHGSHIPQIVLR